LASWPKMRAQTAEIAAAVYALNSGEHVEFQPKAE
jgi:hypothetical protein